MKSFILSVISLCVFLAMLVWISGCTPVIQTKYITTELHHDPRPALPKISADEIQCLAQPTVQKLYDKYRLITDYAITLEAIIDSTKPELQNAAQPTKK